MESITYRLPAELSDRPDLRPVEEYVRRLLAERGEEVAFVVLFGSRAKGNWLDDSDYDLLIGLRVDTQVRFIDRIQEFSDGVRFDLQPFVYGRSEWRSMFEQRHMLMLDALEHGLVLWDCGEFARMREAFRRWRAAGLVVPFGNGWQLAEESRWQALGEPAAWQPEQQGG